MTAPNSQNIAADPAASCFLTANAGSGKTSTLVNRVARLLLNGARPEHILCVTYTKAAAAEMQGRLFERLGHWAVTDDDRLADDLRGIDERPHDLPRARALFAKALETPGGLKIQTIHAFCEKLLRRFPLEAQLSPAFHVLDDLKGQALADRASAAVLTFNLPGFEHVGEARDRLIRRLKISGFEALLKQFIYQHDDLKARLGTLKKSHNDWAAALFHSLGLDGVCTSHDCLAAYAARIEWQVLRDVAAGLSAGTSKTNQEAGRAFFELNLRYQADGYFDLDLIRSVFHTKDGSPRKTLYTKETDLADRIVLDRMAAEITELAERLKAVDIAANTLDALYLFEVFSHVYQQEKQREGALDFTDLINRTKKLLSDFHADWVLYKLDGGLEHILIDEAQDTSEVQWKIAETLSADFFAGEGQVDTVRTVFAVGDEKQSIYGFQGADPQEFLKARHRIGDKAIAAGAKFVQPELIDSWRTLPDILEFVDALFGEAELAHALTFSTEVIRHVARRQGHSGLVELWPLVRPIAAAETTADDQDEPAALDDPGRNPPSKRLARQIAVTIRDEIATGRAVYDKGEKRWRPVHAGDVLILVRKRDQLFEHIIRELKMAGVAVSGADRLKLGDHIAFQDLRALLRVCLQPRDSLALACVLRSPLCDLSEGDLFELSRRNDGQSLWSALLHHPAKSGPVDAARIFLTWAVKTAWQLTGFDFLSRVLNRRDLNGLSLRQRFLTRLGDECEDVLDETLALALKGESAGAPGISACLDLFEYHASEIKREQEEGGRAVRVMTVHGSKGLEAPWVIVPVGPQYGARKDDPILTSGDGLYLCAGGRKGDTAHITAIRTARALRDDQESLRLLYVALTRARDRLTVCGYAGTKAPPVGNFPSWYDLAEAAFERLPDPYLDTMKLAMPFDDAEQLEAAVVRLYGLRSEALTAEAALRPAEAPLPGFATAMVAQADIESERWAAISQMGDDDREATERAPSPLQTMGTLGRYRRGNLIHKLFEILPDISPDKRGDVAERYLARQDDLSDDQRREMTGAVMAVLGDTRFAEAFGPQSRPEIALAGQVGVHANGTALMLSGRIDRLVVTADRVVIIDYKSNRPAPDRAEDAAIAYQRQMAGYVALLRQVYPDKAIEAALLWTDGPKLTPLSETLVNLRLAEILTR